MNLNDLYVDRFVAEQIGSVAVPAARLLDVGCGKLPYLDVYSRAAEQVVGLDVERRSPATALLGSAVALPFRRETFDIVVCCEVIEHLRDPLGALNEMARVLRPGGRLILTWPFMYGLHEIPHDFWRPTEFAIAERLESLDMQVAVLWRRGSVAALVYSIVMAFIEGPLIWSEARAGFLRFVPRAVRALVSAFHVIVFRASLAIGGHESGGAGRGLRGLRGQLRLWHLGYCLVAIRR